MNDEIYKQIKHQKIMKSMNVRIKFKNTLGDDVAGMQRLIL